jgi:hypothetical protein
MKSERLEFSVNAKVGFDRKDGTTATAVLRFLPPSQRDEINQPRGARNEPPWVRIQRNHNPERVEPVS